MRGKLLIDFWAEGKPQGLPRPISSLLYKDLEGKNRRWFPDDDEPRLRKDIIVMARTPEIKGGMKATVQKECFIAMRNNQLHTPVKTAVIVDAVFVFGANVSDPLAVSKMKADSVFPHIKKPDIDNIIKGLLDGMTSTVFTDDTQVVAMQTFKVHGRASGVRVRVYEADFIQINAALTASFPDGICPTPHPGELFK